MNKILFFISAFLLFLTACSQIEEPEDLQQSAVSFNIYGEDFEGEETRTIGSDVTVDMLKFYFVRNGSIVNGINAGGNNKQIMADGLVPGEYTLLLLGIKGDYKKDGAVINELQSPDDVWLSFPETNVTKPLQAEYFHAAYNFVVTPDNNPEFNVPMKHVAGRLDLSVKFASQYIEASTKNITVSLPDTYCYTQIGGNGELSRLSALPVSDIELTREGKSIMLMPAENNNVINGNVDFTTQNHVKETECHNLKFTLNSISGNIRNKINIDITNKDVERGMVYGSKSAFRKDNFYLILQDDESKNIFYNKQERWCYINEPLQINITDDKKLHLRYYCARPMRGITIYAKFDETKNNFIELAYIDELPAFADVKYELQAFEDKKVFKTKDGEYITLKIPENIAGRIIFDMESEDGLMNMFKKMTSKWKITFDSYGGDPDLENGGPVNKWIGIRPVHIRSALCILQNIAYLLTFRELHENVRHSEYNLKDDNNNPIVGDDRYQILLKMINMKSLKLGLVYSEGTGSRGLGGYGVLGVDQEAWTGCYFQYGITTRNLPTIIHEIGHNMGYLKHAGCMTAYGSDAYVTRNIVPQFYLKKWIEKDMPIDKDYVKPLSNPNLYRFK